MSVTRLTDLPHGNITYFTYEDLDAGRLPAGAVWFEQLCDDGEGGRKRYRAGGVLVVMDA